MNDRLTDLLSHLFAFDITAHLLRHDFVQQALVAGALLGLVAGLVGPFIVMRQMSFAVHGSSELSLTGAAFALLVGYQVGAGALVGSALAAALFGILGQRARERDSAIGVVLAFGLGLAVLFIHLYPGHTGTSFALLTGQIVGVGYTGLVTLAVISVVVVVVLVVCYRPLLFATVDPEVAAARGVPVRVLGIVFAALVGIVAAEGVRNRRRAAGGIAVDHAGGSGRTSFQVAGRHDRRGGALRRNLGGRRHRAVVGARRAGVGVRRHHFVPDLPGLLAGRAAPTSAGPRLTPHACAVGRTTTSPISTSAGWSIAKAIARATALGGIAISSRRRSSSARAASSVIDSAKLVSVMPGDTIVTRRFSPAS